MSSDCNETVNNVIKWFCLYKFAVIRTDFIFKIFHGLELTIKITSCSSSRIGQKYEQKANIFTLKGEVQV